MTGHVLHHQATGATDGDVLLMVGSLGTTLAMWDPQVSALSADRSIVRVDVRGHGGSPVPTGPYSIADLGNDVVTTLDELGISRVSICGLSIGGMIGMWLSAHAPERVERLIVICTSAHMPEAADAYRERARTVRDAGSTEPVADGVLGRWFTPDWTAGASGDGRRVPPDARRDSRRGLRRML